MNVHHIDEVITELVLAIISSNQLYLTHKSLEQQSRLDIVHMDIEDDQVRSGALESSGDI